MAHTKQTFDSETSRCELTKFIVDGYEARGMEKYRLGIDARYARSQIDALKC